VRCYPGADGQSGSSVLYEDDGESTGYRDGASATTALGCSRAGDDMTVHIEPTQGAFAGQLAARTYVIEFPASRAATMATLDGAAIAVQHDAGELVNRVRVPLRSIGTATRVTVRAPAASDDELRRRAFAARTGAALTGSLEEMVRAGWLGAGSDREKLAVLAAAGAGVWAKNENLYGYPASARFIGYQTPWAPAAIDIASRWVGGVHELQEATVTFAGVWIAQRMFGDIDLGRGGANLASAAAATFSSLEQASTSGIADGRVGGYPGNRAEEWSTAGESANASVRLTWSTPQRVSRVVLYDRINPNDRITSGRLTFSDGSTVDVGAVPNTPADGPLVVEFPARSVSWLEFRVTGVSATTENVGLAELAVYGP
jgi:hypothetical protein